MGGAQTRDARQVIACNRREGAHAVLTAVLRDRKSQSLYKYIFHRRERIVDLFKIGGDLLSHNLSCSTIGATGLIGRVRDGIGSLPRAMSTNPKKINNFNTRGVLTVIK